MPARSLMVLVLTALITGCATAAPAPTAEGAAATSTARPVSHRPAAKTTCVATRLTRLPDGIEPRDRELVPLSSALLGVETTFGDGHERTVIVVAGGYLDDVLEAYDDLETIGRRRIGGAWATVLGGRFLDATVHAAYWRDTQRPPCDMRAIVATNLSVETFLWLLSGVR